MKQANNNEVDLLLRSFARGRDERALQSGATSGDGNRSLSNHLDADELNSYAEGVVPAAARARYTGHLADCQQCRRIVIGLTQAAGVATRYESPEQQRGASFWQTLAALFSPAVLRYAVTALAVAGVIGIGLLALRQQRSRDFIAQNEPAADTSERLKQTESPAGNSAAATRPEVQKTLESASTAAPGKPKSNVQGEETRVAQAPGADSSLGNAPKMKDAAPSGKESGEVQPQPSYAPEIKASAPPPTNSSNSDEKSAGIAEVRSAKREDRDERERQQYLYKNTPSDEHGPNRSAAPRSAGAPVDRVRSAEPTGGLAGSESNKNEKPREADATTTVAGRRFKHEGNTWVDTAYESSRPPINIARGSEQFRALVADEPGLRTIADQLRGVVIVVWKNRAYRIH
jgi:hypothetical protein